MRRCRCRTWSSARGASSGQPFGLERREATQGCRGSSVAAAGPLSHMELSTRCELRSALRSGRRKAAQGWGGVRHATQSQCVRTDRARSSEPAFTPMAATSWTPASYTGPCTTRSGRNRVCFTLQAPPHTCGPFCGTVAPPHAPHASGCILHTLARSART